MVGLPITAWERFGWWLLVGLVLYFVFGYRNSLLRRAAAAASSPH
jgi:APA family basic amino acid/polyamine antiporter